MSSGRKTDPGPRSASEDACGGLCDDSVRRTGGPDAHSGQSAAPCDVFWLCSSRSKLISLTTPPVEQISCPKLVAPCGDASAAPMKKANHASTRLERSRDVRSVFTSEVSHQVTPAETRARARPESTGQPS